MEPTGDARGHFGPICVDLLRARISRLFFGVPFSRWWEKLAAEGVLSEGLGGVASELCKGFVNRSARPATCERGGVDLKGFALCRQLPVVCGRWFLEVGGHLLSA